jgi:hypothetical protein
VFFGVLHVAGVFSPEGHRMLRRCVSASAWLLLLAIALQSVSATAADFRVLSLL